MCIDRFSFLFSSFLDTFWRHFLVFMKQMALFGVLFTILAGFAVDVQVRLQIVGEMLLIRDIR